VNTRRQITFCGYVLEILPQQANIISEATEATRATMNIARDYAWNCAKDSLSMLSATKAVVMSNCIERMA
jgi:hypothetical protein